MRGIFRTLLVVVLAAAGDAAADPFVLKRDVLRAQRTQAEADRARCREMAEKLLSDASVTKVSDRTLPWLVGLSAYAANGFLSDEDRLRVTNRLAQVLYAPWASDCSKVTRLMALQTRWVNLGDWEHGGKPYFAEPLDSLPSAADPTQAVALAVLEQKDFRHEIAMRLRKLAEDGLARAGAALPEGLAYELVDARGTVCTEEIPTRWGKAVTPENVWREYPRPQLVRGDWQSLNGTWDLTIAPSGGTHKVLVPFPVESPLSGVHRKVLPTDELVYRRTFVAPRRANCRTILRFESVDWRAHVFVNGEEAGLPHEGQSVPFGYDVTDLLKDGENELVVRVWDPTDDFIGSTGKQTLSMRTCFFPASSGICGSVWTECVPNTYLEDYAAVADVDAARLTVTPVVRGCVSAAKVSVEVLWQGKVVARGTQARSDRPVVIGLPRPLHLWSPDDPALYALRLVVEADGQRDVATGYFGARKLSLMRDAKGIARVALNDKPLFLLGELDQGYWPDGYTTPPSEAALRWDVDFMKSVGFNTIRKHIKIEPRAFYAHCDKVGVLLMQDLPSAWTEAFIGDFDRANRRYAFQRREMKEIVDSLRNHPSIVCWIAYNEGWGQPCEQQTLETGRWFKRYDPTRLLDLASGWCRYEDGWRIQYVFDESLVRPMETLVTDILDDHVYPGPKCPKPNAHRAVICGEYGGIGATIDGHCFDPSARRRVYKRLDDAVWRKDCRERYRMFADKVIELAKGGASGSIMCENLDCFWEHGGLVTADREVERIDRDFLRTCHAEILEAAAKAASEGK